MLGWKGNAFLKTYKHAFLNIHALENSLGKLKKIMPKIFMFNLCLFWTKINVKEQEMIQPILVFSLRTKYI